MRDVNDRSKWYSTLAMVAVGKGRIRMGILAGTDHCCGMLVEQ
jgi:hypothetical protein